MANARMVRQDIDDHERDYASVMGEYNAGVEAFNKKADYYNSLPAVTYQRRTSGDFRISDGRTLKQFQVPGVKLGDRFEAPKNGETYLSHYEERMVQVKDSDGFMREELQSVPVYLPVAGVKAALPGPAPGEPENRTPSFTKRQWDNYNSPQPTYAEAGRAQGKSVSERFTGIDDWRSGITTVKGILQRVLQGAKK